MLVCSIISTLDNKLLSNLKIEKTISGGSVANSIVGLAQLDNKVGFIGKVSDDDLGSKYEEGLKKESVEYFYSKKKEESKMIKTYRNIMSPSIKKTYQDI